MNGTLHNCSNCGGRLTQSPDGRAVSCGYCGSSASVAVDPRALAAGIGLDAKTQHEGFHHLLKVFSDTLPSQTTTHQTGMLFKKVTGFDVALGEQTFRLTLQEKSVIAQRMATVRGITIKTETLSLESWVASLAHTLAEMAGESASARDAFARIAR